MTFNKDINTFTKQYLPSVLLPTSKIINTFKM